MPFILIYCLIQYYKTNRYMYIKDLAYTPTLLEPEITLSHENLFIFFFALIHLDLLDSHGD